MWYFGSWDEGPQEALKRYLKEKDDILAGRDPRAPKVEAYTLGKLCNEFLNAKGVAMERTTITSRHFRDLMDACERLVDFFGAGRVVETIGPEDFEKFGFAFPATWKLRRHKREIGAARAVFTYAVAQEKIVRTCFGTFKGPSKKELAVERQGREREHGNRDFTPEQLRDIIKAASVPPLAVSAEGLC
jgi:hypothetical protein